MNPRSQLALLASYQGVPDPLLAKPPLRSHRVAGRILLHATYLLIALACFAASAHYRVQGQSTASLVSLIAAAVFAVAPVRDILRIVFRLEGTALHIAHSLGSLGLLTLPLSGTVSRTSVLNRAWMAPFAIMGAAQAVMHQNHPRNAEQASALQRFALSLPEVAQFTNPGDLTSPQNARRAVAALSDVLGKAQSLGQTELDADPGLQSALRLTSARIGANLGLDMVQVVLQQLAANPMTSGAVPGLRRRLAEARQAIDDAQAAPRHVTR